VHKRLVAQEDAGNNEADSVIGNLRLRSEDNNDEIWITDLSWNSPATGAHLTELSERGAQIFWIDHHRTAVSRADAPEFKVPFAGKVLSEQYSAARLTFNFLKRMGRDLPERQRAEFDAFQQQYFRMRPIITLSDLDSCYDAFQANERSVLRDQIIHGDTQRGPAVEQLNDLSDDQVGRLMETTLKTRARQMLKARRGA